MRVCAVDDCEKPHYGRGWCQMHWARDYNEHRIRKPCSIAGCDRPAQGRGWCSPHYGRWQRYGDPEAPDRRPAPAPATCTVDGCGKPHLACGYCRMHYDRLHRGATVCCAALGCLKDRLPICADHYTAPL